MGELRRPDAEEFLYREARLIDERAFDDWLTLFADDAVYCVPSAAGSDPVKDVSIIYDDRATLESRVRFRQQDAASYAQSPPSRVQHFISNVEVVDGASDAPVIHSSQIIYEARAGSSRAIAARCTHRLRREGDTLKIAEKRILLIDADQVQQNLTFIL